MALGEEKKDHTVVSVGTQKTFVIDNANILDRATKLAILKIVMLEVGPDPIMEDSAKKNLGINLDLIENEEIIRNIYNIVYHRREALSRPATAN